MKKTLLSGLAGLLMASNIAQAADPACTTFELSNDVKNASELAAVKRKNEDGTDRSQKDIQADIDAVPTLGENTYAFRAKAEGKRVGCFKAGAEKGLIIPPEVHPHRMQIHLDGRFVTEYKLGPTDAEKLVEGILVGDIPYGKHKVGIKVTTDEGASALSEFDVFGYDDDTLFPQYRVNTDLIPPAIHIQTRNRHHKDISDVRGQITDETSGVANVVLIEGKNKIRLDNARTLVNNLYGEYHGQFDLQEVLKPLRNRGLKGVYWYTLLTKDHNGNLSETKFKVRYKL